MLAYMGMWAEGIDAACAPANLTYFRLMETAMKSYAASPAPAPGDHQKSPVKLPTEPDTPTQTPVAPQPEDSPGHANAAAAPDRRAHSVEDAHADGSDRSSETESPRGSAS